jgi:hypothetical protein
MSSDRTLKLIISVVALGGAVLGTFQRSLGIEITPTVAVLLALAILPWLSPLLQSAELPGGWKLEFRRVETEQIRQRADIDALRFLVSGFVTEDELVHLRKIAIRAPFAFVRGPETTFFLDELRRLRALGLVANHRGKGIRRLEADGGDVNTYFFITNRGREYLKLRDQIDLASGSSAPTALGSTNS